MRHLPLFNYVFTQLSDGACLFFIIGSMQQIKLAYVSFQGHVNSALYCIVLYISTLTGKLPFECKHCHLEAFCHTKCGVNKVHATAVVDNTECHPGTSSTNDRCQVLSCSIELTYMNCASCFGVCS